jgi:hypothetical protein
MRCVRMQGQAAQRGMTLPPTAGSEDQCGVQPVVPPGALAAIVSGSYGKAAALPAAQRARLHHQAERLRELALAGVALCLLSERIAGCQSSVIVRRGVTCAWRQK